jgi:glutamine synthetase
MTPGEILRFIKENGIQIVDLKFNDLPGLWQHFSIPASELTDIDDPTRGIWVDGIENKIDPGEPLDKDSYHLYFDV